MIRCFEQLLLTFKKNGATVSNCEEKLKEEVVYLFDFYSLKRVAKKNMNY